MVNKVVFQRAAAIGRDLGVTLEYIAATKPIHLNGALRREIAEFLRSAQLPAVYFGKDYVDAGGLSTKS